MVGFLGVALLSLFTMTYDPPGAGVILLRNTSVGTQVLLVQNIMTGRWGFTKGTREPFDSDYRANAVREVIEEAGLQEHSDYTIYDGPCFFGKRPYWFGRVHSESPPSLLVAEHMDVQWRTVDEITSEVNKDLKTWLKKGNPGKCKRIDKIDFDQVHDEL